MVFTYTQSKLSRLILVAGLIVGLFGSAAGTAQAATPTNPCPSIGGGKYNCNFYTKAPVYNAAGSKVGSIALYSPVNYVYCQTQGITATNVSKDGKTTWHNNWWAWTLTDNVKNSSGQIVTASTYGWVNAVYASGGSDYGKFNGVPACNGVHGSTPASLKGSVVNVTIPGTKKASDPGTSANPTTSNPPVKVTIPAPQTKQESVQELMKEQHQQQAANAKARADAQAAVKDVAADQAAHMAADNAAKAKANADAQAKAKARAACLQSFSCYSSGIAVNYL